MFEVILYRVVNPDLEYGSFLIIQTISLLIVLNLYTYLERNYTINEDKEKVKKSTLKDWWNKKEVRYRVVEVGSRVYLAIPILIIGLIGLDWSLQTMAENMIDPDTIQYNYYYWSVIIWLAIVIIGIVVLFTNIKTLERGPITEINKSKYLDGEK
jgi:hypothetical protein